MYVAEDDKVYVKQIGSGELELFLTVHPTDTGGLVTVKQQACQLADMLNFADRVKTHLVKEPA